MAVNEIVLVANGNGHGHVIVRWGHGLLRKRGENERQRMIRYQTTAASGRAKTRCFRGKEWTQKRGRNSETVQEHKGFFLTIKCVTPEAEKK